MIKRTAIKRMLVRCFPPATYLALNEAVAVRDIRSGRRWEPEIGLLPKLVCEGETALDIGGNHGLYAYHLSKLVGASGRVHTFEPIPYNLSVLRKTVERICLPNVTIHAVGCGEIDTTVEFILPTDKGVPLAGLAHRVNGAHEEGVLFPCPVRRIDLLVNDDKVSFVKCDIEGSELFAFRGTRELIERNRPTVLCEISRDFTARFETTPKQIHEFFGDLGYSAFRLEGMRLITTDELSESNFLFLHPKFAGRASIAQRAKLCTNR